MTPVFIFENFVPSISFLANPLYPSDNAFDFLLCTRVDTGTTAYNGPTSGIPTFNLGVSENQFSTFTVLHGSYFTDWSNSTVFSLALVNHYENNAQTNLNDGTVIPLLFRVGGFINSNDLAGGASGIAVLLDQNVNVQAFPLANLLQPNRVYGGGSDATATFSVTSNTGLASDLPSDGDYYPAFNGIFIKTSVTAAAEFNFFVPVTAQSSSNFIKSAMVAFYSDGALPEQHVPISVFKAHGVLNWGLSNKAPTLYGYGTFMRLTRGTTAGSLSSFSGNGSNSEALNQYGS